MTHNQALKILKLGHNVLLTGPAGSGKTFLLNQFIHHLKRSDASVGITASTGIAATHLGGTTIHSWAGFGIKDRASEMELRELLRRPPLRRRLRSADVLIIDEISMLHAGQLDMADRILRLAREANLPFGGIQVVLCGDFFQLPPVSGGGASEATGAYGSKVWPELNLQVCYLEEQHRQDDPELLKILEGIRCNCVSDRSLEILKKRMEAELNAGFEPVKLYTHNFAVDDYNQKRLDEIDKKSHFYEMKAHGKKNLSDALKRGCLAPELLELKKGASVMFVKNNFEAGYVNGTVGEVIDFDEENFPIVETTAGDHLVVTPVTWVIEDQNVIQAQISQLPLRLAWAVTVHKSQGMSLDAAEIDLSRSFVPGMGYVALSRVRALSGLKLLGLNAMALQVDPRIVELDRELKDLSAACVLNLLG